MAEEDVKKDFPLFDLLKLSIKNIKRAINNKSNNRKRNMQMNGNFLKSQINL